MRTIEAQGLDRVFGGLRFAAPLAIGLFDEVGGEIVETEIDESYL